MRRGWALLPLALCLAAHGQEPSFQRISLNVGGLERSYLVHVPPGAGPHLPVVMMLHERGSSADSAGLHFGWPEEADREHFLAVFPQALPIDPSRPRGAPLPADLFRALPATGNDTLWWTSDLAVAAPLFANPAYPPLHHAPDGPYLAAVIADMLRRYQADAQHVYLVGFSSGAAMASDFAAVHPEALRGVAIVGSVGLSRPKQLSHPLSVFLSIGDADRMGQPDPSTWNSLPAALRRQFYGGESMPTFREDAGLWARLDGCRSETSRKTAWGAARDWTQCDDGVRVRALTIANLSHEWPGSSESTFNQSRKGQPAIDLTRLIWGFFSSGR